MRTRLPEPDRHTAAIAKVIKLLSRRDSSFVESFAEASARELEKLDMEFGQTNLKNGNSNKAKQTALRLVQ